LLPVRPGTAAGRARVGGHTSYQRLPKTGRRKAGYCWDFFL
jgi:hypothetical protein